MKFLTIDYIKQHSRIDFDCEDGALELYASAAEDTVLALVRRTLDNVKDMNGGKIPPKFYHAALMLTDQGYQQRSPASAQNMSAVPYGFDLLIKDQMRLDGRTDLQAERDTLIEHLETVKTDLDFGFGNITEPTEEQTEQYAALLMRMVRTRSRYTAIGEPTEKVCQTLRKDVAGIRKDCDEFLKTE